EGKMKQFASWFTHGVPGGSVLRKAVYEAKQRETILDAVDRFFESLLNGKIQPDSAGPESTPDADLIAHPAAMTG
ncbi:MAG TPA: tRNA-dihydrouridine synthase, partial [Terriglobales bacterium]